MIVLVDMDEVLCCFVRGLVGVYGDRNGVELDERIVRTYSFDELRCSRAEFAECMSAPGFWESLDPVDGALAGMAALRDAGHQVHVVTAVPGDSEGAYDGKARWLRAWLPWFDLNRLTATSQKHLVAGDVLFDDCLKNLERFRAGLAVALARPWNEGFSPRVESWPEFVGLVERVRREGLGHGWEDGDRWDG